MTTDNNAPHATSGLGDDDGTAPEFTVYGGDW
jgi:hypothetical protein